jgi:hypothetical protein
MTDINYVIILDCYTGRLIKIKLTSEEKRKSGIYEDFEDFIKYELERKYGFSLDDSSWMCSKELDEVEYNF